MNLRERLDRIMMAITFAEAGEHDTARRFMGKEKRLIKSKRVSRRPKPKLRAPSARR
jgi:hypothetical protein